MPQVRPVIVVPEASRTAHLRAARADSADTGSPAIPAVPAVPGDGRGAAGNARGAATAPPARTLYRIGIPDSVRAITSRWISLVPSKIV